ncbi:cupredoxin domain-containing protein [Methylocystis sp. 9N]|uniref:Cupredoxin domain-containing protein n=1 Tax=Methylocystis borbori TaxID=3118750 RepID=A0ABU7XF11_9HYPH
MQSSYIRAALAVLALFGLSSVARAENAFTLTIKDHRFEPSELKVPANQAVTLTVKNLDATPEEFESKTLRIEKVIPANSEASFTLRPLKPGRYKFVGEFHEDVAKGEVIAE